MKRNRIMLAVRLDWKRMKYAMVYRSMDHATTGKNLLIGGRMQKKHDLDLA